GNVPEVDAQIARDGHGLEENFRQDYRGAPIEISATAIHLRNQRAKKTKVLVGGCAERRAVGHGMHVRDVRTNGQMHGDRYALLVGLQQYTGSRIFGFYFSGGEEFSSGFAVADSAEAGGDGNLIEEEAGFRGHAKL